MAEDKKAKEDSDDNKKLILKLDEDDSALVVRTNGEIELISRELQGKEDNYLGDLEDLNRTFTLVLAFAAAIENERLYNEIFHNLNYVLQRQWSKLPEDEKIRIQNLRSQEMKDKHIRNKEEWLNKWREEIERGRQSLEDFLNQNPEERDGGPFGPDYQQMMDGPRRRKRKKRNPLAKLKDVAWNPYDETLKALRVDGRYSPFKGNYKLDDSPDEEDE